MPTTHVQWLQDKTFLGTSAGGAQVIMGAGDQNGVSPMQMLLLGLGGCSAIDVVDILQKQRQPPATLDVFISGTRSEVAPRPWSTIHMHFVVTGEGLDAEKVRRAIDLSVEKYCGAHATLKGVATITHDFEVRAPEAAPTAATDAPAA